MRPRASGPVGVLGPSLRLRYAADTFKASGHTRDSFITYPLRTCHVLDGVPARLMVGTGRTAPSAHGAFSLVGQVHVQQPSRCAGQAATWTEGQVKDAMSDMLDRFSFGGRGEKTSLPKAGVHSARRGLDRAAGTSDGPLLRRARPELAVRTWGRSSAVTGLARGAVGFGGGGVAFRVHCLPSGLLSNGAACSHVHPGHLRPRCHRTRSDGAGRLNGC